jgi:RNA polymerase sigma factor (TIGR02999 family)
MPEPESVSDLLRAWGAGDQTARDRLIPVVYRELKRRAGAYMGHERKEHTLQPTALVNEVYLRLLDQHAVDWKNRAHFFGISSQLMRRVLVDHAREHLAAKRGGHLVRVELGDDVDASDGIDVEVLMLHEALEELARVDPRQAQIVEMKYFGGMTEQEIGEALSLSRATITREWQTAKAWLFRRLTRGRTPSDER